MISSMNGYCQGYQSDLKTSPNILLVGLLLLEDCCPGWLPWGFIQTWFSQGTNIGRHNRRVNCISQLPDWICSLEESSQSWRKLGLAVESDMGGKAGHGEARLLGLFCVQKVRAWNLNISCGMIFLMFCL